MNATSEESSDPSACRADWRATDGHATTATTCRTFLALAALGLADGYVAPVAASPDGTLTWGVHASLTPAWFDPS